MFKVATRNPFPPITGNLENTFPVHIKGTYQNIYWRVIYTINVLRVRYFNWNLGTFQCKASHKKQNNRLYCMLVTAANNCVNKFLNSDSQMFCKESVLQKSK